MIYAEKLKDQRWKFRRYQILKRDKHTCKICGYVGTQINVHHKKYSGEPWDAPDEDLITLCKYCHKTVHTPELNDKKYDKMHISNFIKILING